MVVSRVYGAATQGEDEPCKGHADPNAQGEKEKTGKQVAMRRRYGRGRCQKDEPEDEGEDAHFKYAEDLRNLAPDVSDGRRRGTCGNVDRQRETGDGGDKDIKDAGQDEQKPELVLGPHAMSVSAAVERGVNEGRESAIAKPDEEPEGCQFEKR